MDRSTNCMPNLHCFLTHSARLLGFLNYCQDVTGHRKVLTDNKIGKIVAYMKHLGVMFLNILQKIKDILYPPLMLIFSQINTHRH